VSAGRKGRLSPGEATGGVTLDPAAVLA